MAVLQAGIGFAHSKTPGEIAAATGFLRPDITGCQADSQRPNPMNTRQHAVLSRALVQSNGGADNCLNILEETPFKIGRTYLYDTMDHDTGRTLPAGAIAILEQTSGHRAYSQALTGATQPPSDADCAVAEICEANEVSAMAQRLVRLAAADKVFTESEKREIEPLLQQIEAHLRGVRAAMDAGAST